MYDDVLSQKCVSIFRPNISNTIIMSSSNKKSNDDVADISIIRSSDGSKQTFSLPLSKTTLTTLKETINSDPTLGPIGPSNQRLFHLGRELKSSNRSLETLGIGRFNVFTVHLHTGTVTKTKQCLELLESDDEEGEGVGEQRKQAAASSANNNDDDDEVHVVDMTTTTATTTSRSNRNRTTAATTTNNRRKHNKNNDNNNEVVDLLDDSDSDDDDVVEIIEPSTSNNKRRKRN